MVIIGTLMSKERIKKAALEIVEYIHGNIKACNIPNQKKKINFLRLWFIYVKQNAIRF